MGVSLAGILEWEEASFESLSGKIVAIDAYNTLYQFLSTIRQPDGTPLKDSRDRVTSHLSGIIYRTTNLVEKGIKPIFVFDGKPSHLKAKTLSIRSGRREEAKKKWEEAKEKRMPPEETFKYAQASTRINAVIVEDAKMLLTYMGVPHVQAKSEGESQAAYMVRRGDAEAVCSQDYDSLLFGAPVLIRNLSLSAAKTKKKAKTKSQLEVLELAEIEQKRGITREQLVDIAILVGTDFNGGIKGIGAKRALKLIKKHGNIERVIAIETELGEGESEGGKGIEDYEEVRSLFLRPDVNESYELKWREPEEEKVKHILCEEHDFSEERVSKALERMVQKNTPQRRINQWL